MGDGSNAITSIPTRTLANTRLTRRSTAQSLTEFEHRLDATPWFSRLGQASSWDALCERISSWTQWPGPENDQVEAFALMTQDWQDRIFAASSMRSAALQTLFDTTQASVVSTARKPVRFEEDEDSWHGPTQCAWDAGFVAGAIACVLASGFSVPDDLIEIWNWYESGHWPCGFAADRTDAAQERDGAGPRRLLVL